MLALLLLAGVAQFLPAPPFRIRLNGNWSLTLRSNDLLPSAIGGADWVGTFESSGADNPRVTISGVVPDTPPWRVDVRRTITVWPAAVPLYVRRITDGTGPGTISGGLAYQAVTAVDQQFFTGTGDRSQVDLQLRLESVSAGDATDYDTEVFYTLAET